MAKPIYALESLTLRESGMRAAEEYEIIGMGARARVSLYSCFLAAGEDDRRLERRRECAMQTVLDLLNDCRFGKWDGFIGKHPFGVRDGTMFNLTAVVNDGKTIRASGSENFPKHYAQLREGLRRILTEE